MKTLVITPTYGRLPFLGRLLASFLSQTYDDKELVLVNDDANVQLVCDVKNVTCINLNKKILVAQKRNLATQLGYHDLYMPHDDDDIFLPDRIANHVKIHKEDPELNLYRNTACYIIYGDSFYVGEPSDNFVSFTRKGWFAAHGYSHDVDLLEDKHFLDNVPNHLEEKRLDLIDSVYNYGGVNYHLSSTDHKLIPNMAKDQLKSLDLKDGKFYIEPDFEEYNKFVKLDKLYKQTSGIDHSLKVIHTGLGKIEIA